ncbi:MAG TPA: chromosome partition protein MukB, partial [Polyangiaceae bacterium]
MSRARATALALVNWKGVFYERYLLDPNVTALEGANGAGKTTVMIAAYVVLMPDMSRLRFTNLGESGATGGDKGIWGRLGEPGSASYAAIEVELHGGARILAGVELTRKAEPSVELTPFLITGLNPEARLQDLLLQRRAGADEVPTRAELAENAKALGGSLQVYATTKDYFAALFEHGVSPLRLSTDEDRNKFNEMLRTSMTGGISRALTSELRSFLLREESGLGDTLSRMRGNLDACRRTRVEVSEAQRLEHEIAGVYEAGQGMFAAALLATREEANELSAGAEKARASEAEAGHALLELDRSAEEQKARHTATLARSTEKRARLKAALEGQAQLAHARSLAAERATLEAERVTRTAAAETALAQRERAAAERVQQLLARDRARDAYERSAQGLADIQKGLDELHRNAHRERRAKTLLGDLRELLREPTFEVGLVGSVSERAKRELERIDGERLRCARDAELVELRRSEHHAAAAALRVIDGSAALDYEHGQRELVRLGRLQEIAERAPALGTALQETEALAARQSAARRRAHELGLGDELALGASFISSSLEQAEGSLQAARETARTARAAIEQSSHEQAQVERELAELEARTARRNAAYAVLSGIEANAEPWTYQSAQELALRLDAEHDALRESVRELSAQREAMLREANEFESHGGSFQPELLRLRDELDAELLLQRFDDIEPEQAAALEARLGPLVNALVVRDPGQAAEVLAGRPRELENVWLVASDTRIDAEPTDTNAPDVIVAHGFGVRVTRLPAKPMLGRRARLQRAHAVRAEAEGIATRLDGLERRCRRLEATLRELEPIVVDPSLIGGERLGPLRDACHARLQALREGRRQRELEQAQCLTAIAELEPRVLGLRALLVDAFLLDGRDHTEAYRAIAASISEGEAATRELVRVGGARRTLEETLQALRFPPGATDALDSLNEQRQSLDRDRDRWFRIREQLAELAQLEGALDSHAETRAEASVALVPALEQQHESARQGLAEAEALLEQAEQAREQLMLAWQAAEGERAALVAQCVRLDAELSRLGVGDFSALDLRSQTQLIGELSIEAERFELEERELGLSLATLSERRRELARAGDLAWRALTAAEKQAQPSAEAWQALHSSVTQSGLASASWLEAPA